MSLQLLTVGQLAALCLAYVAENPSHQHHVIALDLVDENGDEDPAGPYLAASAYIATDEADHPITICIVQAPV